MRTQGAGGGVMASNTTLQEADSGAGLVVDNHGENPISFNNKIICGRY